MLWLLAVNTSLFAIFASFFALKAFKRQEVQDKVLAGLLNEALTLLSAKSLKEKVDADQQKSTAELNLQILKDAFEKDRTRAVEDEKKAKEPQYVKTSEGDDVDLRDYEVLR